MRTLVVSDLHLGSGSASDLLRRPELRAPLLAEIAAADRLVILGDGIELRDGATREVMPIAAPFFEEVGRALGPDGELVLLAGNHDHALVAPWLEAQLLDAPQALVDLERRIEPEEASPLAARLAALAAPARVTLAHPGIWLREDVYAMHGNYIDVHTTVPTVERLLAGGMARFAAGAVPESGATPDDYERVLAPLYAWVGALAQRADRTLVAHGARASARTWLALSGRRGADGRRAVGLARAVVMRAGFRGAVAALNAAGLGPLRGELDGDALRQGSLLGMREVVSRLDIRASHVIWGHSHRSGPWPGDDPREWIAAPGTHLINTGSWVFQPHFLSGATPESPYWPGTAVELVDDEAPRLIRLLATRGSAELTPRREPAHPA